jgi:hypothetical protein
MGKGKKKVMSRGKKGRERRMGHTQHRYSTKNSYPPTPFINNKNASHPFILFTNVIN